MKNLVLIATMVLATAAQARPVKPAALRAELTQFHFQKNTFLADANIDGGSVIIDRAENELLVTLYRYKHCPPGMFCTLEMPAPVIYRAQIESEVVGGCNEKVYRASINDDYVRTVIQVTDYRTMVCEIMVPGMTAVHLSVQPILHYAESENHVMYGGSLRPIHK